MFFDLLKEHVMLMTLQRTFRCAFNHNVIEEQPLANDVGQFVDLFCVKKRPKNFPAWETLSGTIYPRNHTEAVKNCVKKIEVTLTGSTLPKI